MSIAFEVHGNQIARTSVAVLAHDGTAKIDAIVVADRDEYEEPSHLAGFAVPGLFRCFFASKDPVDGAPTSTNLPA